MRLRLASRKSDLARWQAVKVARTLEATVEKPQIEFIFKSSFGDQNLDIPLAGMGARGVFTEDFYKDLTDGNCDLVVHSWKDLPIDERSDTVIAMTLARADVRDILLLPEEVWERALASKSLTVLTSSPRRVYNLATALPILLPGSLRIEFKNVRGNVPTRLRKMREEGAGLVLAKAGLDRLLEAEDDGFLAESGESVRALIKGCRFQVLPVSLNPPAPAQGALAIEVARTNHGLIHICERLNDREAHLNVREERAVLSRYGGGCHQKIGVARLTRDYGTVCALRGLTDDGKVLREWRIEDSTAWTRARSAEAVFPREASQNSWFARQNVTPQEDLDAPGALFVARAEAWPQGRRPRADQIVWTAGVQTWVKLAARGIFVSGCQDGLGENEPFGLDQLAKGLSWAKLSHTDAGESLLPTIATYRLEPKTQTPDLSGKTHFFWMSRTSFAAAQSRFPREIREGFHGCGPGHTWEFLREHKDLKHAVKVFAGLEQFLHESLP